MRAKLMIAVMVAAVSAPAFARDHGQFADTDPAIRAWYGAQQNAQGQFCCNKADGHDFYGAYTIDKDGSVEFDAGGVHHHLPAYMVLTGPNPTGHAVWWFLDASGQGHYDYCFAPGGGA